MSDTKIKALTSFSDGVISMAVGEVGDVESTKASAFIDGGLAVAYTEPIIPTGSETVTANGTYDIKDKAEVVVNVGTATVTYDVNGGTGSIDAVVAIKGNQITLNDGTDITAPAEKVFSGWATTSDAEASDVSSPYTVTADVTLYAFYVSQG